MERQNEYACSGCANKGSPLCQLCEVTVSPSGKKNKPTQYIRYRALPSKSYAESYGDIVRRYLDAGLPVPLVILLKYNTYVEEGGEKDL